MGVHYSIKVIGVDNSNNEKFTYIASGSSDGLAIMLKDKERNYRTEQKLADILTQEEIESIYCIYGERSSSVLEGWETYNPEPQSPDKIINVLDKMRRFYLVKLIKEKDLSNTKSSWGTHDDMFMEILFDVKTLSEIIAALTIAKQMDLKILLTISD